MSLQVQLYPAMQTTTVHARLPGRATHGATLCYTEDRLQAAKQTHVVGLLQRPDQTAAIPPREPRSTRNRFFLHASSVAHHNNCGKTFGCLLSSWVTGIREVGGEWPTIKPGPARAASTGCTFGAQAPRN